jgi:pSer/pThr/pTyr-binding forkhead associated (FHA) protein
MSGKRGAVSASSDEGARDALRVWFKSKVVSRKHCEFVCKPANHAPWFSSSLPLTKAKYTWHVRDTGSSSGTFLNGTRLSVPGEKSKEFEVRDGDVVQLGVDYHGGGEEIHRAVRLVLRLVVL